MTSKADTIAGLEGEILKLNESLEGAKADADEKRQKVEELERARIDAEKELVEAKSALEKLQTQTSQFDSVHEEVCYSSIPTPTHR